MITAVSALIASWLFPAFTKQWQDRQNARELQDELVTKLDEATTRTVIAARFLVDRRSREAQATDARASELRRAGGTQRLRSASLLRGALERERDATATTYIRLFSDWLVTRSVTRSRLSVYFPGTELDEEWAAYADHVGYYLRLASRNDPAQKSAYIHELRRYLDPPRSTVSWSLLAGDPRSLGTADRVRFGIADGYLTEYLLERKNRITHNILGAHVAGFSTTTHDFLRDLVPF